MTDHAFPLPPFQAAMTLRDYFAAAALLVVSQGARVENEEQIPEVLHRLSVMAFAQADAMLAERARAEEAPNG